MKKRKWAAALMSMALATAMISGCSVIKEETSQSIYQPQINPLAGQNISETITSNFYYVVEGENQLASVSQTIEMLPAGKQGKRLCCARCCKDRRKTWALPRHCRKVQRWCPYPWMGKP